MRKPPSANQVTTSRSRAERAVASNVCFAPSGAIFGCRRRTRLGASGFAGIVVFTCPSRARLRSARLGSRVRSSCLPSSSFTPSAA
jgi:hypothetical protein